MANHSERDRVRRAACRRLAISLTLLTVAGGWLASRTLADDPAAAPAAAAAAFTVGDLKDLADESVIEILTHDEDGALRETKIWVVVVELNAYVRTNRSRWLENIRRGSSVLLRVKGREIPVTATEEGSEPRKAEVEEAFLAKYGFTQRVMSAIRVSEPSVLRLDARASGAI
jgi:hypothetical protein